MAYQVSGFDTVLHNLDRYAIDAEQRLRDELDMTYGASVEATMQGHAPWNDITGQARAGLLHYPDYSVPLHYTIVFSGLMYYNVFLELRWNGRYAVIYNELMASANQFLDTARRALAPLGWAWGQG